MSIKYAQTYEVWTEDDIEFGETADAGFEDENAEADFRDMVSLLEGTEPSSSTLNTRTWYTNYGDADMEGEIENNSYHPKNERDGRYMMKAWKLANGKDSA